jgi:phosphonate transport system substrate-binding protein
VADLKGKRVAHVSQTSSSGHQAPVFFFTRLGVVPGKDYEIVFSSKHDNSVLGVVNGDYDAAPVADTVLERMVNRGVLKRGDYKIVYTSPVFPTAGFAYYYALDPKLAAKIKGAFYTFKIQGTSLGKDFRDATHFVPIDYTKDWEAVAGILEANGVVFSREASFWHRLHVVSSNIARKTTIDALVQKHPHDTFEIIRAAASSRKATTCSRLTVGNPARKSSIVSPPSR